MNREFLEQLSLGRARGVLGQCPVRELLVHSENRVLRPSRVRHSYAGDPGRQLMKRNHLQLPPALQHPRPDSPGNSRTPHHHRGQPNRLTNAHRMRKPQDLVVSAGMVCCTYCWGCLFRFTGRVTSCPGPRASWSRPTLLSMSPGGWPGPRRAQP